MVARRERDPQRWLRGAAGEQATAALLARLPARRWVVLHDRAIPGSRANIDHLVVGPTGVWVIDSKSSRARVRAAWRSVWLGDRRLDSGPTRWEAEVASDRLGVAVRPLIVVHGVGLRRRGGRADGVRVVPAGYLLRRLRRGRRRLGRREVDDLGGWAAEVLPAAPTVRRPGPACGV
jgi:Nuclease-related domain